MKTIIFLVLFNPVVIFAQLVSTAEVTIVSGPFIGNATSDSATHVSRIYKAIVNADDPSTNLDDALLPLNVLLTIRYKKGIPLTNRWIVLESGGNGLGYCVGFGVTSPGNYVPGGSYGDDLIRWYNDSGFVTFDITWECRETGSNPPCGNPLISGWVPPYSPQSSGPLRNTGGSGYIGMASRTRAILQLVLTNNGGKCVGAHGHSGGSGRLITTLTRYGGEKFFNTVVFDGGPVFAYIPWFCEITGNPQPGPLGPVSAMYNIMGEGITQGNYDEASDSNNYQGPNNYTKCVSNLWDSAGMMANSNFFQATDRDFPGVNLVVVLGGIDNSPATPHARLWFNGYTYGAYTIPSLSAKTITIIQGYCASTSGNYTANTIRPCTDWAKSLFPTTDTIIYDATLVNVSHSTAASFAGATAMFRAMLSKLGRIPEACPPIGIGSISNEIPREYKLYQNYPNPFNPATKIQFALPKSSFAKLVVYDALGRELETLVSEQLNAGTYEADWSADKFSSGVYFYKLVAGEFTETKKMVLIK